MLEVRDLKKYYKTKGGVEVHALDGVSIEFPETGMVFLLGKSGSGKSTLLNVSGGLDKPDSGEIIVKGKSSKNFSQADFDSYRNTFVGFVFQEYNILNEFNVETNIALALELQGKKNDKEAVAKLLDQVDLGGLGKRKPNTLSGGQKQRIAIARALIKEPEIIMADEPTGALDSNTGKQVFDTLKKLSETKLVIVVSHDREFAEQYGDRIIELKDGKILTDHSKSYVKPVDMSKNIKKIGKDTIQIKNLSEVSKTEFEKIFNELKGDGEVIISKNSDNVATFKKVAKISEDGQQQYFEDTDTNNIDIKKYDGSQTKFIKSRLPAKHAFKLGASNLKIKPVRLIFTMFLSIVAFTLFGILSTLMLYNPAYSYSSGINDETYQSLKLGKKYSTLFQSLKTNEEGKTSIEYENEEERDTYISKKDIEDLNNSNNLGLEFAGFYNYEVSFTESIKTVSDAPFYAETSLYGLCDCGEEYLERQGFEKRAGRYPTAPDEIAVSTYIYDIFDKCEYVKPGTTATEDIDRPEDLLDKEIKATLHSYSTGKMKIVTFKIVGIYDLDTALYDTKYEPLKDSTSNEISPSLFEQRKKSFHDVYESSFSGLGYVSTDFYDTYKSYLSNNNNYVYITPSSIYGFNDVNSHYFRQYLKESAENKGRYFPDSEYMNCSALTLDIVKENASAFTFYDTNGNKMSQIPDSLEMDETYLPVDCNSFYYYLDDMMYASFGEECAAYDREGNATFFPCKPTSYAPMYYNPTTNEIEYENTSSNYNINRAIISDDGEILYIRGDIYCSNILDKTDFAFEEDFTYFINVPNTWINVKDGTFDNNIETVDISRFYYEPNSKKIYLQNDVTFSSEKKSYVLSSNQNAKVDEWKAYYLDSDGNIQKIEYTYQLPKTGLWVNKDTKELSLTKQSNCVFTDKYFIDENGNLFFGNDCDGYCYTDSGNENVEYSFNYGGVSMGYTRFDYDLVVYRNYASGKEKLLRALVDFYCFFNAYDFAEELIERNPGVDFSSCNEKLDDDEYKLIIEAANDYRINYNNDTLSFNDPCALFGYDLTITQLKVKGFFIVSSGVQTNASMILSNGWLEKSKNPYKDDNNRYEIKYITKYIPDEDAQYDFVISKTDKTTEQLTFMLKKYDDDSYYRIDNLICNQILIVTNLLSELETIFLVIGIVMAVFSGLMLFNFISTSISYKQKEIGILRAVGARGSDVFKIYFSESGLICGICFVLSAIASVIGCYFMNEELADGLAIKLFDFNLINVAIVLAVAIVVGIVGTLLPVIKASKRPPVESIRAL